MVGGEDDAFGQGCDVEVTDGGCAGGAVLHGFDGLGAAEDATRAAEFLEVFGEKRVEGGAILLAVRVKELLFKVIEVSLQLGGVHGNIMPCFG